MSETCPKCGSRELSPDSLVSAWSCGTTQADGYAVHESTTCLRAQLAAEKGLRHDIRFDRAMFCTNMKFTISFALVSILTIMVIGVSIISDPKDENTATKPVRTVEPPKIDWVAARAERLAKQDQQMKNWHEWTWRSDQIASLGGYFLYSFNVKGNQVIATVDCRNAKWLGGPTPTTPTIETNYYQLVNDELIPDDSRNADKLGILKLRGDKIERWARPIEVGSFKQDSFLSDTYYQVR